MAAGRTAGREIGLPDLSNARALRETYGICHWETGIAPIANNAANVDVLGLNAGAGGGDILNVLGGARVVDVVGGDDRVTCTTMDFQPDGNTLNATTPRRLTWTYTDAAAADAVGTIVITGLNAFADLIQETIAFAPGTLTGDTVNAFRRVISVVVRGAAGLIDVAADTLHLRQTQHIVFGPVDPTIVVAGAARLDNFILHVQQNIAAGAYVVLTPTALNAVAAAVDFQVTAINANGECSLLLAAAQDFDAAFMYAVTFRYRAGQSL